MREEYIFINIENNTGEHQHCGKRIFQQFFSLLLIKIDEKNANKSFSHQVVVPLTRYFPIYKQLLGRQEIKLDFIEHVYTYTYKCFVIECERHKYSNFGSLLFIHFISLMYVSHIFVSFSLRTRKGIKLKKEAT